MKSILDKDFKYIPACATDIKRRFAIYLKEQRQKNANVITLRKNERAKSR